MAIDTSTAGTYKDLLLKAAKIANELKKINQSLDQELSKQIPEAIKNNDEMMIGLKLKLLRTTIQDIELALRDTELAVTSIEMIDDDETFSSSHHDDLEKLTKAVAAARTKLTSQLEAAKKLESDAKKGFDKAFNSKEEAFRELARFELEAANYRKRLQAALQKASQINTQAEAAVEARDAKALADDQKAMQALGIAGLISEFKDPDTDSGLKDFLKRIETDGIDPDALAKLKEGATKLLTANSPNKGFVEELEDLYKQVLGYKIAEIDVKKAAKALKIDPKIQSKVEPARQDVEGPGQRPRKRAGCRRQAISTQDHGQANARGSKKGGRGLRHNLDRGVGLFCAGANGGWLWRLVSIRLMASIQMVLMTDQFHARSSSNTSAVSIQLPQKLLQLSKR